ncbi:unnamed protein product [Polarella glacialis]|uniref:Presequence protease, mitochondrial n=1 Tax=Polarella glacialis TaxID=89957 RepID=A0A813FK04_POLGL|nr:unnamed protein product [Polarella glacialis]CAE8713289.1 unnamed protein product [Polarella glacialis]|mmetsp:Transcript_110/g.182  ORF Transcript_110/g.182 Transcript_110/m.182 type:complete len:1103 (+) Transcript_110:55-3363(+)
MQASPISGPGLTLRSTHQAPSERTTAPFRSGTRPISFASTAESGASLPSSTPLVMAGMASLAVLRRCSGAAKRRLPVTFRRQAATKSVAVEPPRGALRLPLAYKPGDRLAGGAFEVTSVDPIAAYNVTCVELVHLKTGARWLHVDSDDSNNVFNVAFRTTPVDSTGVAHILEHTALCGSARFPVRDPFFNMLKRSLSTFMNAMTAPDYTMYPYSTMNAQDYMNLLEVYLDAAFFPRLTKEDFLQEGHRLEFKIPGDPESGVQIKGIVFNEMKGAMGSQGARFGKALGSSLFPTSTYNHNSGGDPVNIPDLTHEDLLSFHSKSYHPSNARFYTYGDLPLEQTLERVEELALSSFSALDVTSLNVQDEVRYSEPQRMETTVPADAVVADPTKQSIVSTAWLLVNQISERDSLDSFALAIASNLLLDGPQAVFYEALIEPGWGTGFAPGTGYGGSRRETSLAVGLKGVAEKDVPEVEKRILETMEKVARDGLPRESVNTVLHQIELGTASVSPNFGLGIGMGVMSTFVHGGDPLRPLRVTDQAARLVTALDADPNFWQELIKRRFVDNPHRVTVVAHADPEYDAKLEKEEQGRLDARSATLSPEDKAKISADTEALKQSQDQVLDPDVLPTLCVADAVPKLAQTYISEHRSVGGVPTQYDAQPTNGITYATAVFDLSGLPDRLVPYLSLFASFLSELGTRQRGYKELAETIKGSTGGVGASISATPSLSDPDKVELSLFLSSNALDRNVGTMFELMGELVLGANFAGETARLQTLLKRRAAAAGSSISSGGLSYARSRAEGSLSASAALGERLGGLHYVAELQRYVREDAHAEVSSAMGEIAAHVFSAKNMRRCRLVAQPDAISAAEVHLTKFIETLPQTLSPLLVGQSFDEALSLGAVVADFKSAPRKKAFIAVPTQTNFVAKSMRTVPYSHPDSAPLYLLGQAMSTCFLHKQIREIGGAYGGGSSADPTSGTFVFNSYRDPNSLKTLEAFEKAVEWAATPGSLSARDVEEAHLRTFKSLDAPRAPSSRGASHFTAGLDDASRQLFRDRLLACTVDTLRDVAERHLLVAAGAPCGVAIVGNAANVPVTSGDEWVVLGPDGNERQ